MLMKTFNKPYIEVINLDQRESVSTGDCVLECTCNLDTCECVGDCALYIDTSK